MIRIADSHVHLHAYADVDGLLERAQHAGVRLIVGVSVDPATSRETIEVARRHVGVVAAIGLHPVHLSGPTSDATLQELHELAQDRFVGMIGEIGLDSVDSPVSIDQQRVAFEAQLRIAKRCDLAVNLHLRGAFDEAFAILARVGVPNAGAVLHYFVGDETLARRALDLGLYVSVGKPVTRLENARLRDAVRIIPLDRLLLETDSYPLPKRTTEPADVWLVARAAGDLMGISEAEVARVTCDNLMHLLADRAPGG